MCLPRLLIKLIIQKDRIVVLVTVTVTVGGLDIAELKPKGMVGNRNVWGSYFGVVKVVKAGRELQGPYHSPSRFSLCTCPPPVRSV